MNHKWIHDEIDRLFDLPDFVGNVVINIFKGGCSNIEIKKTIKPPKPSKTIKTKLSGTWQPDYIKKLHEKD